MNKVSFFRIACGCCPVVWFDDVTLALLRTYHQQPSLCRTSNIKSRFRSTLVRAFELQLRSIYIFAQILSFWKESWNLTGLFHKLNLNHSVEWLDAESNVGKFSE
jgi:hypothetical protein